MAHPAGESESDVIRLDFDRRLMLQFGCSVVTSDAGLLAYRELDDTLGLTAMAGETLADARTGKNGRHVLVGLLRQSVFGRLAGYEDVNDAERLRHDPAMRWIVGGKAARRRLCQSRGLRVSRSGADQVCDPAAGKPGPAGQDRLPAQTPGRATTERGAAVSCQLQLSGRELDQAAPCDRQGRVASRRTLSPRRLHRDEHEPAGRARRRLLQQARNVRTMDQRGQGRDQMDAAVMPDVRRQRRSAPASCARLQPRQFPAHAGDAGADQGLVADELEGKADKNRREGGEPRPLYRLPDGRSRHPPANVPGDTAAHCRTTAAAATSASVRWTMIIYSRATDRRSAPERQGKTARSAPGTPCGLPEVLVAVSTARQSCVKNGKARLFTPVREPSGESRLKDTQ